MIRFTKEQWEELKRLAAGQPISQLVRQAVAEFIERQKAKKQ